MFDWLRKVLGPVKEEEQKPTLNRNISDITISVKEGLSGTREIQVTSWNPDMTMHFFKTVRDELRENP